MRIAQALDNFIFPTAKFTKCKFADGSHRFELHQQLLATLNAGDLSSAVKLPPGENPYEFVTTNIVFFFNSVNLLFDSVSDFCTPVGDTRPRHGAHASPQRRKRAPL
eukprot:TRINITY_DN4899_c0_g1_i2.p3 TRINITY_DN4899_c0_g1~~TRINITY_DN4899_c0_g1_i2.p3  ORF type:complete len:107 (+),score=29.79 TRINITY_DN4899_c0_g1_i2:35-355(+)